MLNYLKKFNIMNSYELVILLSFCSSSYKDTDCIKHKIHS